jgi:signal recognition particle GTPase
MIAKMGSFSRLIGMIPGMNKVQLWTYGAHLLTYIMELHLEKRTRFEYSSF